MATSELQYVISAKDEASRVLTGVGNSLGTLGLHTDSVNKKMLVMGGASVAAGALLLKGVASAVGAASEFEDRMTEIWTLMDGASKKTIDDLGNRILDLSTKVPQSAAQLAEGLYWVTSAGFSGAKGMEVLTEAAKLAVASLSDTGTTTDVLSKTLNAYGMTSSDVGKVSDIMFTTVAQGMTRMSDLAPAWTMVAGLAATAGIKVTELGAAFATMTRQGLPVNVAGTALRGVISNLLGPSDALKQVWAGLSDKTLQVALQQEGLTGVMGKLQGYFGVQTKDLKACADAAGDDEQQFLDLAEAKGLVSTKMKEMFPNVRGLIGMLTLMANGGKTYTEMLDKMNGSQGATGRAFAKMSGTVSNQWKLVKNAFSKFLIEVGSVLLPVVGKIVGGLRDFALWLSKLPGPVKTFIAAFAAIGGIALVLGGLGTIAAGLRLRLASMAGAAVGGLKSLGNAAVNAVKWFGKLFTSGGPIAGMFSKIGSSATSASAQAARAGGDFSSLGAEVGATGGGFGLMAGGIAVGVAALVAGAAITWKCWSDQKKLEEQLRKSTKAAYEMVPSYNKLVQQTGSLTVGSDEWKASLGKQEAAAKKMSAATGGLGSSYDSLGNIMTVNVGYIQASQKANDKLTASQAENSAERVKAVGDIGASLGVYDKASKALGEQGKANDTMLNSMRNGKATVADYVKAQLDTANAVKSVKEAYNQLSDAISGVSTKLKAQGLSALTTSDVTGMIKVLNDARPEFKLQGMQMFQQIVDAEKSAHPEIVDQLQGTEDDMMQRIRDSKPGELTRDKMIQMLTEIGSAHGLSSAQIGMMINDWHLSITGWTAGQDTQTKMTELEAAIKQSTSPADMAQIASEVKQNWGNMTLADKSAVLKIIADASDVKRVWGLIQGPLQNFGALHTGGMVERLHTGGLKSHEVPTILQLGEYVLQPSAVQSLGTDLLDSMNSYGAKALYKVSDKMVTSGMVAGSRSSSTDNSKSVHINTLNVYEAKDADSIFEEIDRKANRVNARKKISKENW